MSEIGNRYGHWVVIEEPYRKNKLNGRTVVYVRCRCDCGVERVVRWSNIKHGHVTRCGPECTAYIDAKAAKMDKSRINTVDKWLEVFNNDMTFVPKPASEATDYPPGSMGKMNVMRRRLENGESLFHSDDSRSCEWQRNLSHPDLN